jgi:predicted Rossmann fold nucleotide-binding protein DprA/Smf involved in DNA uptake
MKSCEHCAKQFRYTPADQCRFYEDVHGKTRWLCDPCANAGAPLLKEGDDFGSAPHNGTETSEEAAHLIEGKLNQQCFTVLGVVAAAGPSGVTREEVCERAGVVNQAVCARLNTLEKMGLVRVGGEKRMAATRRLQQVYHLAGIAA